MRRVTTRRELIELNKAEHEARKAGGPIQRAIAGAIGPLVLWVKYSIGADLIECHRTAINQFAGGYTPGAGNAVWLAQHMLVDPDAFLLQLEPSDKPCPSGMVPYGEEASYCADRLIPYWADAAAVQKQGGGDPDKANSPSAALVGEAMKLLGMVLPTVAESYDDGAEVVSLDAWRERESAPPHMWVKGMYLSDPEAALCISTIDTPAQTAATECSMQEWCTGKRIANEGAMTCQIASRAIRTGPTGGQFATYDDAKHMPAGAVRSACLIAYWLESRHTLSAPAIFRVDPPATVDDGRGTGAADLVDGGEAAPDA